MSEKTLAMACRDVSTINFIFVEVAIITTTIINTTTEYCQKYRKRYADM